MPQINVYRPLMELNLFLKPRHIPLKAGLSNAKSTFTFSASSTTSWLPASAKKTGEMLFKKKIDWYLMLI